MKKKFAVIGYGGQGFWHTQEMLANDVVILKGVYDIQDSRNRLAEENGIYAYESVEALLADPEVDAVVVATPNDSHKELVIRAMEAGKHVICEKPVEMTCAAFDEMVAVAEKTGKIFTVHQNRRWDGDFLTMKNLMESGEIGGLLHIESRVHGSRGIPGDWRGTKAQGGGMMLDWGVHLIDQMLQFIHSPVIKVYCTATHYTNTEVDDGFKLELTFRNGQTAHVEVGTYNFISMPRFYMQCERGSALIQGWQHDANVVRMSIWNEKEVTPVQTAAGITKTMAPRDQVSLERYMVPQPKSDVHDFYRNFCAAVDGTQPIIVKLPEVRRVLQVMEAALASIEKEQVVTVHI